MIIIAYLMPLVLFFSGLLKDRSKLITVLMIFYFLIIIGLNTYTPDYIMYEFYYYNTNYFASDIGYAFICNLFNGLGLTFQEFRMVVATIYTILIYSGIKGISGYPNAVLSMYLLSGLRFSLSMAIFINAIQFLQKKSKSGMFKYIISIVIACLLHIASIYFFLFLVVRKKFTLRQYMICLWIMVFLAISAKSNLLLNIATLLNNQKLIMWLSMSTENVGRLNITGFFVYSIALLLVFITTQLLGREVLRSKYAALAVTVGENKTISSSIEKINLYMRMSFCTLFIIPFYLISSEYQRYFFSTMVVSYAIFAEFRRTNGRFSTMRKLLYEFLFIMAIILTVILYMYSQTSHDILATLTDNVLFQ